MPLTAAAFKFFQIEEVETTAARLVFVLGMGGDGGKYDGDTKAMTIFFFSKPQLCLGSHKIRWKMTTWS